MAMVLVASRQSGSGYLAIPRVVAVSMAAMAGFAIRLILLATPFHGYDSFAYGHWTWRLVHQPLIQFYFDDGQAYPDHLPGDVWLLKIAGEITHIFDPGINFYAPSYTVILVCMVMLFDALAATVIWRVGTRFGPPERATIYALAYWLAPAPIFVASVWGQTDGISTAIAIVALALGVFNRYSRAVLVLTLCVMVKPQFGLLLLPLLVGWWRTDGVLWPRWLARVALTGVTSLGLVAVLAAPFHVSLVGEWGRWSLIERLQSANDLYPVSTLGAHNIWILFDPFNWPPGDRTPWFLGMSRQGVGLILFSLIVAATIWILVRYWRGPVTMVLASNLLMLGFFLVMTRMHERYAFPVVALSILLATMDGRYRRYAVVVNVLVFANIAFRFYWPGSGGGAWRWWIDNPVVESTWTVYFLVAVTWGAFGWLVYDAFSKSPPDCS